MKASAEKSREANRRSLWPWLALIFWTMAILVVTARLMLSKSPTRQDVFPVYHEAGQSWLAGRDLYRNSQFDYRYSPLFAAAMVPISVLPLKMGSILWRLFGIGLFLGALFRANKLGIPETSRIPILFLLILPLALGNVNNGQANLLVIGLLVTSVAAVIKEKWTFAAISVTVAATIKIYPAAFFLPLLLLHPRELLWRAAVCVLAAVVLPFLLQSPDYVARQYVDWFQYLRSENRGARAVSERYNDLRLLLQVWSIPVLTWASWILEIVSAAIITAGAFIGKAFGWAERSLLAWLLSLSCCWMLLFGPATESSTYVLIAPATIWIMAELFHRSVSVLAGIWIIAIYGLQLLPGVAAWFGGMKRFGIDTSPLALSALLLAAYLLRPAVFRQRSVASIDTAPDD